MRIKLCCMALALLGAAPAFAQADFNAPFPAHRVIDNVYFVGTEALGSFLITTPEGHILVNSDFESTVPVIRESVESLGSISPTSRSCSVATRTAIICRPMR